MTQCTNPPASDPVTQYFVPTAARALRAAIEEHGGLEVFFVGRPGEVTGKIQTVEALCRGNANSVPAILDAARAGDVVIHNHPSGSLIPSEADVTLAGHYGNMDVGFLIVDNPVGQVLAVVKPSARPPRKRIGPEALEARLGPSGELARTMPDFEWREGQLTMAKAVLEAFNTDGIVAIEAGTGTGKSLAYLLPVALTAMANQEVVVVATHTLHLQEQLYQKDAPLVRSLEGMEGLRFAILKGRRNYLCNRKYVYYRQAPGDLFDADANRIFDELDTWVKRTPTGTRGELNYPLPDGMWERLAADQDDCTRVKCPQYEECFYYRARRSAASANILIVNQHLLLADLAVRHAAGDYKRAMVLPPYTRVILDEGHHLEQVATSFTSEKLSERGLNRLLGRLLASTSRRGSSRKGLLILLKARLRSLESSSAPAKQMIQLVETRLQDRVDALRRQAREYLKEIGIQLKLEMEAGGRRPQPQFRILDSFTEGSLWREVIKARIEDLQLDLERLVAELRGLAQRWEQLPKQFQEAEQQLALELGSIRKKLTGHRNRLDAFLAGGQNLVRWLELDRLTSPDPSAAICTSPIEVADLIYEMVFEPLKTVVVTSATLSVSGRFDYFASRVGFDRAPSQRRRTLTQPSPFNFADQVYLGIPADVPDPREAAYTDRLIELVEGAVGESKGGAFILFTSYRLLNRVHDAIRVRGILPYPLLKHGEESRQRLLARFKTESNAVLFGTNSFWEGVDVQGDALRLVMITRLPFQVPSEPIQEARSEAIIARGKDPFQEISLPQAVIQFKQGFGRLIRHRQDRGVVLVLDQRIIRKFYGRHFLDAVSGAKPIADRGERILMDIAAFFRGEYAAPETLPRAQPWERAMPIAAEPEREDSDFDRFRRRFERR